MIKATLRGGGGAPVSTAPAAATIDVAATPADPQPEVQADSLEAQLGIGEQHEAAPASTPAASQGGSSGAVDLYRPNRYAEMSEGALQGDFDESDVRHPTLNIVNGSGKLSQIYQGGTVVFADESLLEPPNLKTPDPEAFIRFVPIISQKMFKEALTDEQVKASQRARYLNTIQEVEAIGGTTQWIGDVKPSWSPSARNVILIERPEGSEHPNFVIELDGKFYAVGVYYSSSTAYRKFAQVIFNASLTALLVPVLDEEGKPRKNGKGFPMKKPFMSKKFWQMRIVKPAPGKTGFSSYQPLLTLDKDDTGPEVRDFCQGIKEQEDSSSTTVGE
jgi:hypothetical protein